MCKFYAGVSDAIPSLKTACLIGARGLCGAAALSQVSRPHASLLLKN